MSYYLKYLIIIMLFLNFHLSGENEISLSRLIELSQRNNLLVKISNIEESITRSNYSQQRALPNPELSLSRAYAKLFSGEEQNNLWSAELKLSLPNPVSRHFFLKSEQKNITEAEIQNEIIRRMVIKNLKSHYYRLQFFSRVQSLAEEKKTLLEQIADLTRARVSIGEAREIDHLRAMVEIQKIKTSLFSLAKLITNERNNIIEIVNFKIPLDFTVPALAELEGVKGPNKNLELLVAKSPAVRLKFNKLKQKKFSHLSAGFSLIDSIDLFVERERDLDATVWRFGIGLEIPIFNTGSARTRVARYKKEKAEIELEHLKKHLSADMNRILAQIRILEQEIKTFQGAVLKEGQENKTLAQKLYRAGEMPLIQFLDSQNSFFEIQQRYFEAITELKILYAELAEITGE